MITLILTIATIVTRELPKLYTLIWEFVPPEQRWIPLAVVAVAAAVVNGLPAVAAAQGPEAQATAIVALIAAIVSAVYAAAKPGANDA